MTPHSPHVATCLGRCEFVIRIQFPKVKWEEAREHWLPIIQTLADAAEAPDPQAAFAALPKEYQEHAQYARAASVGNVCALVESLLFKRNGQPRKIKWTQPKREEQPA
jgi:hypothetical protein